MSTCVSLTCNILCIIEYYYIQYACAFILYLFTSKWLVVFCIVYCADVSKTINLAKLYCTILLKTDICGKKALFFLHFNNWYKKLIFTITKSS